MNFRFTLLVLLASSGPLIAVRVLPLTIVASQQQTLQFNIVYTCGGERLVVTRCRAEQDDAYCSVQYPDRKGPATGGMTPELAEKRGDVIRKLQACGALPQSTSARVTTPAGGSNAGNDPYYGQGKKVLELKEYAKAVEANKRSIAIKPTTGAYSNLGSAYLGLKQYQEAVAPYKEALRLMPDNGVAQQGLGQTYYHLKQYTDAIAAFQRALNMKHANPYSAYSWIGLTYPQSHGSPATAPVSTV